MKLKKMDNAHRTRDSGWMGLVTEPPSGFELEQKVNELVESNNALHERVALLERKLEEMEKKA